MGYYELPSALDAEFESFKQNIKDFKNGTLDPLAFKTIRVPFGIYEQRTADTYMVRIRLAGGLASVSQLSAICETAKSHADGSLHVTTRGDVQLHNVEIDNIVPILERLHKAGISSRGGGGNTLRNITADSHPKAEDSLFDVSVHASILTTKLLGQKDSFGLPRKYKIAFSSSSADRANATISDVGFIAKVRDGKRGFSVWTAGGMGAKSRLGELLYEFVDESRIFIISEAVKKVFDAHGNRKKKHANRLRFLIQELGSEEFRRLVKEQESLLEADDNSFVYFSDELFEDDKNEAEAADIIVDAKEYEKFLARFVKKQKNGRYSVKIPLVEGDVKAQLLEGLIGKISPLGENIFRFGNDQNIYLYDVAEGWLKAVFAYTREFSRLTTLPEIIGDIISCTGAATCQLGIGLSRGASAAISDRLVKSDVDLDAFGGLKINISGCPNSCGKHPIADIGLYGVAGRFEGRLYPAYTVVVGAKIKENESRFAKSIGEVPAYQLPSLIEGILKIVPKEYADRFYDFVDANEQKLRDLVASFNHIPSFKDDKNPYFDFGAEELFSLKDRGTGECSAGMFDLIDSDQKKAKKLLEEIETAPSDELKKELLLVAVRMLLVTRGEEARDEKGVFAAFIKHFVDTGLVAEAHKNTVVLSLEGDYASVSIEDAVGLAKAVFGLYAKMDHTLKFAVEPSVAPKVEHEKEAVKTDAQEYDLRGVKCPMNFVKTKMVLSTKKSGEVLDVLLDSGSPVENVPNSVKNEGHKIESIAKEGEHWRVRIIKR